MAKKLFNWDELLDLDTLKKAEKELDKLRNQLKKLAKQTKDDIEIVDKEDTKAVQDLIDKVDALTKSDKALTQQEKQLVKVRQQMIDAEKEEAKELEILKQKKALIIKQNKEEAKEALGLTSEYQKRSKRLNELRKKYKDLILVEGKATKETKKLHKEINQLDKELKEVDSNVGQFQRNVGNYSDAVNNAGDAIKGFTAGAVVGASLDKISSGFESSKGAMMGLKEQFAPVLAFFQVFGDSLARTFSVLMSNLQILVLKFDKFNINMSLMGANIRGIFTDTSKEVDELNTKLNAVQSELNILGQQQNWDLSDIWDNFGEKVANATKAMQDQIKSMKVYQNEIQKLNKQLLLLSNQEERLRNQAEDNTLSFQKRQDALAKTIETSSKRVSTAIKIAEKDLEQAKKALNVDIQTEGTFKNYEEVVKLNQQYKFDLEEVREAELALLQARQDALNVELENSKIRRENLRDIMEQSLDVVIDGADNQKTINERIIADDKKSFDARMKLLEETKKLQEDVLLKEVKLIEDFSKTRIDINDLIATSDAVLLDKKLKGLQLDETTRIRLLGVIRDQRTANQDLLEAERDLREEQQERIDLERLIILQKKQLNRETIQEEEKFEKDLLEMEIENLRRRLKLSEEGSTERLEIEAELNEKLLELQQQRLEAEQKAEEDAKALKEKEMMQEQQLRDAQVDLAITSLDKINEAYKNALQERKNELKEQIDAQKNAVSQQEQLANSGLRNTLAEEQRLLADRQKEMAKMKRKEAITNAVSSIWEAYKAYLNSEDPSEALPKAVADVGKLQAITSALTLTFADGGITPDSQVLKGSSHARGGINIEAEGGEAIFSQKHTQNLGYGNFKDLQKMLNFNKLPNNFFKQNRENIEGVAMVGMIDTRNELNDIKKAILNKPTQTIDVKGLMMRETVTKGGKRQINNIRIR